MNTITTSGKRFIDEFGRERIFNGINVCDKGVFTPSLQKRVYGVEWQKELITTFYNSGFNLIRLGFNWDIIEPQPGEYNSEYIEFLRGILDRCEKAGIYVYLDMHQDLYSGFGDGDGDGAPAWATLTDKYTYSKSKFVWAEGYFWGRAVHKAFDNFWDNKPVNGKGLQDYYADMWKYVVRELGNHPAVIGYDLMNEPFPGKEGGKVFRILIKELVITTLFDKTISKKELLSCVFNKEKRLQIANQYTAKHLRKVTSKVDAIIKAFDLERYSPFIDKTSAAVREEDKNGIIFIENSYYSNIGIPCNAREVTVNGKRDDSFAYTPHAYDLVADTPSYKYAGTERIESIMKEQKRMQERLLVPVVFGEWGGFQPDSEWYYHCHHIQSLFDKWHWSNTYWAYFDGLFESPLMSEVLCRPYPRAVSGEIVDYCHNRQADTFEMTYRQNKKFDAPTEIFAHKPIKSVEVDGEYEIKPLDSGDGSVVIIKTGIGTHSVKIEF